MLVNFSWASEKETWQRSTHHANRFCNICGSFAFKNVALVTSVQSGKPDKQFLFPSKRRWPFVSGDMYFLPVVSVLSWSFVLEDLLNNGRRAAIKVTTSVFVSINVSFFDVDVSFHAIVVELQLMNCVQEESCLSPGKRSICLSIWGNKCLPFQGMPMLRQATLVPALIVYFGNACHFWRLLTKLKNWKHFTSVWRLAAWILDASWDTLHTDIETVRARSFSDLKLWQLVDLMSNLRRVAGRKHERFLSVHVWKTTQLSAWIKSNPPSVTKTSSQFFYKQRADQIFAFSTDQ